MTSTVPSSLPPPSFSSLSTAEIQYLVGGSFENFRVDGRSNDEYRPYASNWDSSICSSTGPFLASNGSCRIFLPGSSTDILCSIKAALIHPSPMHPNEGILDLHVETLPSFSGSAGSNSNKTQRMEETELRSILHHLLLPYIVNKADLCVIPSKYVWRLHIDLIILCCDGCVMDVCSMAIRGALQKLILPKLTPVLQHHEQPLLSTGRKVVDDIILDGNVASGLKLSSSSECPVIVTVYLLEKPLQKDFIAENMQIMKIPKRGSITFLVDARSQEEVCACAKVSVSIDPAGNICGIYTYGNSSTLNSTSSSIGRGSMGSIPVGSLKELTTVAIIASRKVFDTLQQNESRKCFDGGQAFLDMLKGTFELRLS